MPPHWTTTARPDLRASGSGRRPQRRMARLQISGHYAYPAVRRDLTQRGTSVLERPQPARCIECHADSLSCPLTWLNIPGFRGGWRGVQGVQVRSCLSSLLRSCIQDCVQEVPVAPLGARRGLPRWLQPASSTSPSFFTKSQVKSFQNHLPS